MVDYDAVIVGAGILVLSMAYYAKNKHHNAQVLVVNKLDAAGQANTAKSAHAFRNAT